MRHGILILREIMKGGGMDLTRNRIRSIVKNQERTYIPHDDNYENVQMEIIGDMFKDVSCTDKKTLVDILSRLDDLDMKMLPIEDLVRLSKEYQEDEIKILKDKLSGNKREYS